MFSILNWSFIIYIFFKSKRLLFTHKTECIGLLFFTRSFFASHYSEAWHLAYTVPHWNLYAQHSDSSILTCRAQWIGPALVWWKKVLRASWSLRIDTPWWLEHRVDKIVCFKWHFYQLQTHSNLCYQLAAHISKMKVCQVSGLFFLVRALHLCQMGCLSFWEVSSVLASGLPILVDAYIFLCLWQWFAILSVRVRGWSLLLGRPSLWLSSLSLRVGYLFMSADCLPLWVGCLSLSMVVYPYEWVVCPTEWVVHICEWDVHPFLFWAGCPCLWVHYCAPYCAWVACSGEWVVCPREWVVCPCEWVVCSCELVLSS